jgi:hypothetical protein
MTQLVQTNNPIATKNTKKALCAFGYKQSAYRRCGLLSCKIIFCRKPVRGAYKRPGDVICEKAFFVFFVAIGLLVWACSFGYGYAALGFRVCFHE